MSRNNGGGIPTPGVKASTGVPAIGRRPKAPEYYPVITVTVEKGKVTASHSMENKTDRALTIADNELGRFVVAVREGRSGTFTLQFDDYVALQGEVSPVEKEVNTQNSAIVYVSGGRVLSTLLVENSKHYIEEAVLRENGQIVMGALQKKDPEQHGTWRISTKDYLTLLTQNSDSFQRFRRITSDKDGTIAVSETPIRLSGLYTMYDFTTVGIESLWKLLQGGSRLVRDLVLREEDNPFLSSEHAGAGDNLLKYVVLSKGKVIQCLTLENRTDHQLPFFDTTLGKLTAARNEGKDGTFLVNQDDYTSAIHTEQQEEGNEKKLDEKDSVIVYIDSGRIVSKLQLHGSNHHIDASVLAENDTTVSASLGNPVFEGVWRISAGTYKLLREQNTDQFHFFRKVTRHMDGTVTVGDTMQLDGYQDLSSYMKGPIDELVRFLAAPKGMRKLHREYVLREEDVQTLAEHAPDKITLPGKLLN